MSTLLPEGLYMTRTGMSSPPFGVEKKPSKPKMEHNFTSDCTAIVRTLFPGVHYPPPDLDGFKPNSFFPKWALPLSQQTPHKSRRVD